MIQIETQPKPRNIFLCEDISQESIKNITNQILEIIADDNLKESTLTTYTRMPIFLFINSYGGSVYDGLALVDLIKSSPTPIATVAVGACMSMAAWIFLAGDKRFVGPNATIMIHEISSVVIDKLQGIKMEVKEIERLQKLENAFIKENTNITTEELKKHFDKKEDWYISAKEAKKLGLADEIMVPIV